MLPGVRKANVGNLGFGRRNGDATVSIESVRPPSVGSTIDGWCTRCKMVLRHTIESIVGEKIKRVHCNTCKGQHAYRARAPRTRAVDATAPNGEMITAEQARGNQYALLTRGRTAAEARPYSASERFKVTELIAHATFGLGAVTAERDNSKIHVLFADGMRILVHGR